MSLPTLAGKIFVLALMVTIVWSLVDILKKTGEQETQTVFQTLPLAADREIVETPAVVDEPAEVTVENQPTPPAESMTPDETIPTEQDEVIPSESVSEPDEDIRPEEEPPLATESMESTPSSPETPPPTTSTESQESSEESSAPPPESSTPSQESAIPTPSSSTPAEESTEPPAEPPTPTEPTPSDSSSVPTAAQMIMAVDFETWSEGSYTETELETDWPGLLWSNGINDTADGQSRASVTVDETRGKILSILFPAQGYGSQDSGALWEVALSDGYEKLCISYDMKVEQPFDFVKGGKLPGLGGGTTPTGGEKPDGSDGFTVRGMFRENGLLESYVYHKDQPGNYGEDFSWSQESVSPVLDEQWHTSTTCLTMNDPTSNNGQLLAWFDSTLVLNEIDMAWRTVSTLSIDHVLIHVFMGGSDASWAPGQDQKIFFDNFNVFVPTFSL